MLSLAVSLLALSASAIAAPTELNTRQFGAPPLPANDPFYQPPFGLSALSNGAVIRSRSVQASNLNGSLDKAYQVLYKTTSQNGTALATVASIYLPKNPAKDRFVIQNLFEDAVSTTCAPSYSLLAGASKVNIIQTVAGAPEINRFLGAGWITVSPDYQGPDSAFGAARIAGRAALDAGRAALKFSTIGLQSNAKVGINGYSGGAFAAGWAAALQPTYAPDLNLVGVVQGGTPANATATLEYLDGGIFAGFGFAAVLGITNAYQGASQLFSRVATQKAKDAFASIRTPSDKCTLEILFSFLGARLLSEEYQSLGARLLDDSFIKNEITPTLVLGANRNEFPKVPLYVFHGAIDEIIPIAPVNKMVAAYCAAGVQVSYNIIGTEHIIGAFSNDATPYLRDRFEGKALPSGCTYSGNTTAISNIKSVPWSQDPAKKAKTAAILALPADAREAAIRQLLHV